MSFVRFLAKEKAAPKTQRRLSKLYLEDDLPALTILLI